ncbi:hypothetical protein GLAREA_00914 [Glarea lozoyensis ATCC 20868]|uniref:NACHT domain-containing protein n=1 Tax=Glarea lozoyensis (strain ATCC 20868 / MF5171) TaxID=1116229 RepID=S3CXU6_GLAL2|nr:uncharacterized protein GLAREA_00914 [Glarea lozoyensis ATCC 20868]EPE29754.1 hypothetical protein GLAREA_00914 [Glarea lozoyensis ATCC 20868]
MDAIAVASRQNNTANPLSLAIREFQGSLSREENAALLTHSSTGLDATGILSFTAEIDRVNANRRSRCVSSRLFGVLESVQAFSGIADTFISSHSEIAALVWGSVKFALLAINNVVSFFDKLSETFLRLGSCCPRFSEYRLLFPESTKLQNLLCSFYASIVKFCTKAMNAIGNPGTTLTRAVWKPFEKEFAVFECDLKKQGAELKEEITLAAEQAASRERAFGRSFRTEIRKVNQAKTERQLKKDRARSLAVKAKLLERLPAYDYVGSLKRMRKKRYGSTGSWLYNTKDFNAWITEDCSSLFCFTGILGSGKSIVTSATVDQLLCNPRSLDTRLVFFFCEPDFASSMIAPVILGSLIRQLVNIETLDNDLEQRFKDVLENGYPDATDLEPLLQLAVNKNSVVTFIIDGIDACESTDRKLIFGILSRISIGATSMVKLLISGRESLINDISKFFDTCRHITTTCPEGQTDIPWYIDSIMKERIEGSDLVLGDEHLEQEIKDTLIQGANGM